MVALMDSHTQMPRDIAEMCERIAKDQIGKIAPYGIDECDRLDAISAGVTAAVKDWYKWDRSKGAESTFVYPKIKNAIIDYFRRREVYERRFGATEGSLSLTKSSKDKHQEQAAWLADVYRKAKAHYIRQKGINRGRSYEMPQVIAIASLMQEEHLSCRGCARLLAQRDDLRAVLKLKAVPHYSSLSRAAVLLNKFTGLLPATEDPTE